MYVNINVVIVEKTESFSYNAKPTLVAPPVGENFVVQKNKDQYRAAIKISKAEDDNNELASLEFSSNDFGSLSFKYEGQ